MWGYLGRRILATIPVVLIVAVLVFRFIQRPAITQGNSQPHLGPRHDAAFEYAAKNGFGLPRQAQGMQQFALETQRVVHEDRLLLDDPIAGRNGLLQRAALDLFVDFAQYMLLVDGLDQPDLQLVGGERFDQIVIGRQFR